MSAFATAESIAFFNMELTGEIPDLSSLQNLEVFKVENNNLSGDGYMALYDVPSLIVLGVAGNEEITGSLDGIGKLTNLQELYLGETKMEGQLPEDMGQLDQLKYIKSPRTGFTGPIPASFGNLKNLVELDFALNTLDGELPEELGELTMLERVALDSNGKFGGHADFLV